MRGTAEERIFIVMMFALSLCSGNWKTVALDRIHCDRYGCAPMKFVMNIKMSRNLIVALAFSPMALVATDHSHSGWETCATKQFLKTEIPPGNGRQYARSRRVDVKHQKIEITPDFKDRSIKGIATIRFSPIARALNRLELDAVDLDIKKVESAKKISEWDNDDKKLTVLFARAIEPDEEVEVTVTYLARPKHGLYFRTVEMGYPKGDDHLWTQGEPEKHRNWFPCYDYPNERFTSEVICHVPEGMIALSNGELISEKTVGGMTAFHWHQKEEHVNYLISLVAGNFKKLAAKHGELPLAFFTPPSEFAVAENSFRDTVKILTFLEKEIGATFPWAKYYNVCVSDFTAGGMENTSITTLTTGTLFSAASENLRSSHRLDAHETTHQWFGDLLTCKDWSHFWLNEGFAIFFTHWYEEEKNGRDAMLYGLYRDAQGILRNKDEKPIVWRGYKDPREQFDYRAYPKGSWVLNMLRSQLGPELFRKCIRTYVERNRNANVVTSDLIRVVEEISGRSYDEFFDQWVFHGGKPILNVVYSWDAKKKQAKFSVKQTQKVSDQVLLFDFELPVRFIDAKGKALNRVVHVRRAAEEFAFTLAEKPVIVRLDPELTVLADVKFNLPKAMQQAQLKNKSDMLGRLLITKTLGGRKDPKSIRQLASVLENDAFYGVRIEAAKSLAKTHTVEAFAVLQKNTGQKDARVRKEIVSAIGKFYSPESLKTIQQIVANEKNPEIVATALGAFAKYPVDQVSETLIAALDRDSFRHSIAGSAILTMRKQGDASYVSVLKEHLERAEEKFTSRGFGSALDSLAYLARDSGEKEKAEVREYISGYLDHPKEFIRPKAISALGTLKDTRSLAVLQDFVGIGEDRDNGESRAAEEAIKKINADKKQADEVRDLRKQVMDLQKEIKKIADKVK